MAFVLGGVLLMASCRTNGPVVRVAGMGRAHFDTEWGYPGSQARMDVNGQMAFSAATRPVKEPKGHHRTTVTATNIAQHTVRLEYGGCPVQIHLYRDEEREEEPVWDSFKTKGFQCPAQVNARSVWSLEDLNLSVLTNVASLADSLGAGHYYLSALVRPNGILVNVPAGEVDLR